MLRLCLTDDEIAAVRSLLGELTTRYDSVEDPKFLQEVAVHAQDLPRPVRCLLNDFRILEPETATCLISSYPVDDEAIGPTPEHWQQGDTRSPALAEEMFLVLCGSLLGDAIAWTTQQAGKLVHDVMPIKGHEYKQISSASREVIWWHTEDAFHQHRADFVGLMCLRNSAAAVTTVACVDDLTLDSAQLRVLFQPRFIIRPDFAHDLDTAGDDNHNIAAPTAAAPVAAVSFDDERVEGATKKVAVLFGDPASPYMRLDPYFMDPLVDDDEAQTALDALCRAVDEKIAHVVLCPGDVCFIDNYRAVHGRNPFEARFDGKDRWLKRILVTRDLRKSRGARRSPTSRVIG